MRRVEPNGDAHSRLEARRDRRVPTWSGVRPGARRLRVGLEALESRQLLAGITAGLVSELSTPTPGSTTDFITFGGQGFGDTRVLAFNDAGTAVGTVGGGTGYLRDVAGTITTVAVPGFPSTIVTDINNAGTIVGYNTFGYGPGFVRDAAGNITTFQIPGISSGLLEGIYGPVINDAGTIAGTYASPASASHGFLRDLAGQITTFDVPGAISTTVTDINNAGTIIGTSNSPGFANYLRDAAGDFSTISVPGSDSTFLTAINNVGTVAGTFVAAGQRHGFLRDAAGRYTTFDSPGNLNLSVTAINDLGMVAGIVGSFDQQRAFVRDAAGNITIFDPTPGSGVTAVSLNNVGNLAGTVFNPGGGQSGFVETQVTSTQTEVMVGPSLSVVGQPVTFTAVVTPGPGGVAPTGSVSFAVDGGAATLVPLTLVGGQMQASLTVSTLPVGNHNVVATYGGSPGLAPSSGVQLAGVMLAPTIISVRRSGFHADPTTIVLGFSTGLDPNRAQDVRNYRIVGPGGRSIAIDSAVYSPDSNTVVLRPHGRLDLHSIDRLTVNGAAPGGVANPFGILLDGAGNGLPGSNFVANLTASNLVLGSEVPGGPARLAYLQGLLAKIEANQSKHLAQLHHSSNRPPATPRKPDSASSASLKPIKTSVHPGRPPIGRPAATT